ncbi:LacI family DNA-binding transcriptional regulator [Streptomyces lateritius]
MKRPTMADIARRAGVSKVAVSYALNDQPGVSDATRASIKAIAQELGWRPNSAARALSGARAQAVGLVVRRPASTLGAEPFFMEFISGIESVLSDRSYALMLQMADSHEDELEVYRRWWGERRVDGVFLVDLHTDDPRAPAMEALGHRRVARVAGPADFAHTAVRDAALRTASTRGGRPSGRSWTTSRGPTGTAGASAWCTSASRPGPGGRTPRRRTTRRRRRSPP